MKRIVIFIITIFIFKICSAPSLSEEIQVSNTKYRISELQRIVDAKQVKPEIKIKRVTWGPEFKRFADHLKQKESSGDWTITNKIGRMGWFQFSVTTLEKLGFYGITVAKFKANPEIFPPDLQEAAFMEYIRSNKVALKKYEDYIGQTIQGVLITISGLLAAAHLGGAGSVIDFLTKEDKNAADENGTSIKDYLTEFAGYGI